MKDIRTLNRKKRISSLTRTRGSTLIIVLVILSLMALIAATLSFTSRLETISSANFAEGLQARMAATTGIEAARAFLPFQAPYTSRTQNWAIQGHTSRNLEYGVGANLAYFTISDESGKLNINTADQSFLEQALGSILQANNVNPAPASNLASEIVRFRYGPDGKPGAAGKDDDGDSSASVLTEDNLDNDGDGIVDNPEEKLLSVEFDGIDNNQKGIPDSGFDGIEFDGIDNDNDGLIDENNEGVDESDEFLPDPSLSPHGDDKPFLSVEELRLLPSMTDEIFQIISSYVTVFSTSEPVCSIDGYPVEKVNVNFATAREIYDILVRRFPEKNPNLLKQFSVNIVDARDSDSVPSQLPGDDPELPFLGIEKTPYINEVWPDSVTDDEEGDDGQYIELFNPYDEPFDLNGWNLEIAGASLLLDDFIAPKGFLIVTDDYDNQNDPEAEENEEGYGSFYDIFDMVRGGASRRIIERRELEIPNVSGLISLKDKSGNLIDYFSYEAGTFNKVKRSFQREDPRVRFSCWDFCTPLKKNSKYEATSAGNNTFAPFAVRNRVFESTLDIMDVFAGFSNNPVSKRLRKPPNPGKGWVVPLVSSTLADDLDLYIIDIFRVESCTRLDPSSIVEILGKVDEDDMYRILKKQNQAECLYGGINLNTAPLEILRAIPGMPSNLALEIDLMRKKIEQGAYRGTQGKTRAVPFKNFSDLVSLSLSLAPEKGGFKGKTRDELLSCFKDILPYITVQSRAFTILSENRFYFPGKRGAEAPSSVRHPARAAVKALVHLSSQGEMRIIDWCYLTR